MSEDEMRTLLLRNREQLCSVRDELKMISKAIGDEDKRRHILRSLASVELALRELGTLLFPGGNIPSD